MKSLFTYPILETSWLIIVTENAGHFYYNKKTQESVWQLSETNITNFSSRIDFNELAILFGKANGALYPPVSKNLDSGQSKKKKSDDKSKPFVSQDGGEDFPLVSNVEELIEASKSDKDIETSFQIDPISAVPTLQSEISDLGSTEEKPLGLDLGYGSSESDESGTDDDDQNDDQNENASGESDNDSDINAGLDLGFNSDDEFGSDNNKDLGEPEEVKEQSRQQFNKLLDEFSSDISIYDPWFIVEEELLSKLVLRPEYFEVGESLREEFYNSWAKTKQEISADAGTICVSLDSNSNSDADLASLAKLKSDNKANSKTQEKHTNSTPLYPTTTQLFYKFLQNYKTDVKKLYYLDFAKLHHTEVSQMLSKIGISNPEEVYRKLRVSLNDFSKLEREAKKSKSTHISNSVSSISGEGNLKVLYLWNFLINAKVPQNKDEVLAPEIGPVIPFNQWIRICNHHRIPLLVANSPVNFVLGDEKRLQCYKDYFND